MENENENIVQIQTYKKSQIAFFYGINISTLKVWLKPFTDELILLGYRDSSKILTPAIVELIFKKLGPPYVEAKTKK